MAQQHGIIVLVDVANALRERTLDGNAYWFDNMRFLGSTGEGGANLVTIVPGTYYLDGSQATEQVLNWLPAALGAIPPTVPRNYHVEQARRADQEALANLAALGTAGTAPAGTAPAGATADVAGIQRLVGRRAARPKSSRSLASGRVLDVTGRVAGADAAAAYNPPAPVITDITGTAVDEKIIYPAQYGSPDMVYDGWYWAATVDTSRPGTYPYTMHFQLHELVERNDELVWEPVDLTAASSIHVIKDPKRNAFTGAGLGALPIPAAPPTP
ncbi:hypothetical protein [Actinomadura rupiterrae]|uniref:hypothetical protein n=1 Tax=Actinomadura rupiterrae TaxID=559627 RepID=UPI0020A59376|nr:hypothetical protein [Actinomadura rupiterrae]MCP2338449.1 hypothetical protein [Actinomadura rupiterrae]